MDNLLIAALPLPQRQRLLAQCEPMALRAGQVLQRPGDRIRHAIFPAGGVISLLAELDDARELQVAMIGIGGLYGAAIALGETVAPLLAVVHSAGPAWRLGARELRTELDASPALLRRLNRHVVAAQAQLARAVGCTHFHLIEQRLARWLLLSRDCAGADRLELTHEFMARMLGVRRVGVTKAAHALQLRGLIDYRRGHVEIVDRAGMTLAACGCYRADCAEQAAL